FLKVSRELQGLLDVNPGDRDVVLELVQGYGRHGYFRKAEELADALTRRSPDDGWGWYVRSEMHMRAHAYGEAQAELERALWHLAANVPTPAIVGATSRE